MEVRLRILYTSVCHTDLSAWRSEVPEGERAFPRILGHEAVGVVESVGEGVTDVGEGDHVIPIFNGECGDCAYCRSATSNLCRRYRSDGACRFRSRADGRPIFHFLNTSTFSQYTVLDSVGAAWNVANVQAGSSVAIFGLGALGLAAAQGAKVRGASKIIGVDINSQKFIKGKAMGVTDFVNPMDSSKPVHERIREMTGGGGVDHSLECVGNPQVLREAFLSTHDGWGQTVLVGIYSTSQLLPLHPMELFDGRSITGTIFGGVKGKSQLHHIAHRCLQPDMNMEELITHELPFEKINEAMQLLADGKALRCIMHL
ncbi:unnamed protein product [Linum tenue]|uniref:Uncharacterized protein n=1 Tax=Linum tenue TaxID=586396 RepID=A0AAV0M517_9ROSI|nr:unnamed protein product [Linum tenue]